MSTEWQSSPGGDQQEASIDELQLGDALADDPKLRAFLASMEKTINKDAPGTSGYRLWDFLKLCTSAPIKAGFSLTKSAVQKGARGFSQLLPNLVKQKSEASEREALIESRKREIEAKAGKTDAEAEVLRAQAELLRAEATEERRQTKRKDALLRDLRKRGIDFLAQQQEGILRICVTKTDPKQPDDEV